MTPEEYAKFTLDRGRLAVLGLLAIQDRTTAELVEATGHPRRDVPEWIGLLAVNRQPPDRAAGEAQPDRAEGQYWRVGGRVDV